MGDTVVAVRPSYRRADARGTFVEALNGAGWGCLIHGRMRAGAVMGNHYHARTRVFFYLTDGSAEVVSLTRATGARSTWVIGSEEGLVLEAGVAHAIRFLEDASFILLKSERYDPADPDTFEQHVL
jgi:dTDP-4-dehydrorhamnose 3,5-epimerase-like enzyme